MSQSLRSCGLTCEYFTPADGFKTIHAHSIFDGLWLRDRLWLATSSGLCVVTPREGKRTKEMP